MYVCLCSAEYTHVCVCVHLCVCVFSLFYLLSSLFTFPQSFFPSIHYLNFSYLVISFFTLPLPLTLFYFIEFSFITFLRASGRPDSNNNSNSDKTNVSSTHLNDPTHPCTSSSLKGGPTATTTTTSNTLSFNIKLEIERLSFTAALSTPQKSSYSSSFSVNSLPFLEFSFHGLLLDTKILNNVSHIKSKISLQEYEVYEVSPMSVGMGMGIGKNSSMQRISSAASFGLPYTYSSHFSQDGDGVGGGGTGSEQKERERTNHSPCLSTFDTIGANDIRNGLKYTRLISRRIYINQNQNIIQQRQQQQNNGKINSHFFSGKLSKNSSRSLQSMTGSNRNNYTNNNYYYYNNYNNDNNNNNNYSNKSSNNNNNNNDINNNNNYNDQNTQNDIIAPLLFFEMELKLNKPKKKIKKLNNMNNYDKNNEVKDSNENKKQGEEKKVHDDDTVKGEEEDEDEDLSGGGTCRLSMEELEILCCPSAHWIAALGTFLVLSPVPEIR